MDMSGTSDPLALNVHDFIVDEPGPAVQPPRKRPLSIVIPLLNEERGLPILERRLTRALDALGHAWEVVIVDDGSTDGTLAAIKALNRRDSRYKAVSLSRNFGKEVAVAAGLKQASGDGVIIMDGDLQHPPEAIGDLVARWNEGYDIVYGRRRSRETDAPLIRASSRMFYKVFRFLSGTELPDGAGDFRLLDRKAVDVLNKLPERARFNKGLYAWIGFKSIGVPFDVAPRLDGQSRWRPRKLLSFALDGIASFTTVPLRVWSWLGLLISLIAFTYAVIFLLKTLVWGIDVPGFPSLLISVLFFSGVQLISLGVIGEYLGRVYEEVKGRPLYIVAERVGLDDKPEPSAARMPDDVRVAS